MSNRQSSESSSSAHKWFCKWFTGFTCLNRPGSTMGDTLDILNSSRDSKSWYRVTASSLRFHLRRTSSRDARLDFFVSIDDDDSPEFMITLGRTFDLQIRSRSSSQARKHTVIPKPADVISEGEWLEFWVTWNNGMVRVGRAGEVTAFIELKSKSKISLAHVCYVSPSLRNAEWKFDLGPVIPATKPLALTGGKPTWVEATSNTVPAGAIFGGYENGPLYIIRAMYNGALTPGKWAPFEGLAYVSNSWTAATKTEFEVLVGYNYDWVPTVGNQIPGNALQGGYAEYNNSEPLYIGRTEVNEHLIVGKVHPSHGSMFCAYGGKEISQREYEILVTPVPKDPRVITQMANRDIPTQNFDIEDSEDEQSYEDDQ